MGQSIVAEAGQAEADECPGVANLGERRLAAWAAVTGFRPVGSRPRRGRTRRASPARGTPSPTSTVAVSGRSRV